MTIYPRPLLGHRVYRPRLRSRAREVRRLEASAFAVIHEVLAALRVVQGSRPGAPRAGEVPGTGRRWSAGPRPAGPCRGRVQDARWAGDGAGTSAILFVGVRHVQAGTLTLGGLLLVIGYLGQLYAPLRTLSKKAGQMQTYLSSAARGAVSFQNVRFAYDSGQDLDGGPGELDPVALARDGPDESEVTGSQGVVREGGE